MLFSRPVSGRAAKAKKEKMNAFIPLPVIPN
jgi:hypothetical protein